MVDLPKSGEFSKIKSGEMPQIWVNAFFYDLIMKAVLQLALISQKDKLTMKEPLIINVF